MEHPFSLRGKSIVITGASSGIGRCSAIECSRMGAKVILIARNPERLRATLQSLDGEGHQMYICDLTLSSEITELVSKVTNSVGKIDGVVNCAGISTTLPFKLISREKLDEFFKSNVFSAFELTRELSKVKHMNSGSSVIFISSIMGCLGESGKSLYGMTKGALISATKSLACEFAKRNIRVNSISPGAILTPINENLPHMADPELRKRLEDKHLLGLGTPEDVAYGVVYLLSDAARWITGQNIIIDGGYTVR